MKFGERIWECGPIYCKKRGKKKFQKSDQKKKKNQKKPFFTNLLYLSQETKNHGKLYIAGFWSPEGR